MAFVLVVETGERFAVGQLQPALGTLQRLDVGLLVHRQYHGVVGRLQIERDNVSGLLCERRIGADAPAPPPLQRDLVLPQHPPDLMLGDIAQMLAQQGAVPTRITGRRRRIQSPEKPPLILGVVVPRLAALGSERQALLGLPPAASHDRRVVRWSPVNVTSAALIPTDYHIR